VVEVELVYDLVYNKALTLLTQGHKDRPFGVTLESLQKRLESSKAQLSYRRTCDWNDWAELIESSAL
jgi:hypothetical protein